VMKALRLLSILGALVALAAGCGGGGGGGGVSGSDVAVVDSIHITQAQFAALLEQAKRNYQQQGRPFPKAGTQDYAALKTQAVTVLVQQAERQVRAKQMGIEVTDAQVDSRLKQIKAQYFSGSEDKYQAQLKKQGLQDSQVRADIKSQLIAEKVFADVTKGVTVSDDDVHTYYIQHPQLYARPQSREVRHILVKSKSLADQVYNQLKSGASFAVLAKKYSQDPGSKDSGGKLTVARGQTVPPFDAKVFTLKTNEISHPVKTQYGWHVIQAVGAVKPATTTPEAQVKDSIREQLLQTKKNEKMNAWVSDTEKKLKGKISYQAGYKPPAPTSTTSTTG
jgi:parvulin-like peptidyl-prolyl isomerase